MSFRIGRAANARIDDIYRSTFDRWGEAQAENYTRALFVRFEEIAGRTVPWRTIPSEFDVDGYY